MAKFIYKMQNVLDIKYKMEEQIKVEFARANEAYNLEVRKLQDFVSRKYGYEEKLRNLYKENLKILFQNEAGYVVEKINQEEK